MIVTVTLNPAIDKRIIADKITLGETNKCILEKTEIAGKGINVSKTVVALGFDSVATGFICGRHAGIFADYLKRQCVLCDLTPIAGEIRTNVKLTEKTTGRETEINENGPVVTEAETRNFLKNVRKYFNREDILCVSGSLPGGVAPLFYKELILSAKESGMRVLFDSSEEAFRVGVQAAPYAIKPNMYEMETFFNEKIHTNEEIKEKAAYFIRLGTEIVALSMGKDGACFVTKEKALHAKLTRKFPIRTTVGAGDALNAALAAAVFDEMNLVDTARFCIAAASASISEDGINSGRPESVYKYMEFIEIEEF
ncbi:MAG: 1-phosphofructokinase family hexose kinase [Clostridiales bacterium]|jgi:1-phosphofructokinase|nr:1-phosphofructokinase family hexose kinase [Clostridiales bacterium]